MNRVRPQRSATVALTVALVLAASATQAQRDDSGTSQSRVETDLDDGDRTLWEHSPEWAQ